MVDASDLLELLVISLRDGYVQVSAFVAVTVLLFGLVQYRTNGALLDAIVASIYTTIPALVVGVGLTSSGGRCSASRRSATAWSGPKGLTTTP